MSPTSSLMIAGLLQDVGPVDVLEVLSITGQSGTLELQHRSQTATLAFADGALLTAQMSPQYRHLTSYFVKRGWLEFDVLHTALERQSDNAQHQLIGQILLELGALTREQLLEGLQHHAQVVLGEVVRWTTGSFEFRPGHLGDAATDPTPRVGIALGRALLQASVRPEGSNRPETRVSLAPKHGGELTRLVEEVIRPSAGRLLIVVTDDLLVLFGLELSLRGSPFNAVQLVDAGDATQLLLASDDEQPILALDLDLMARLGRDSLRVFHILRKLRRQWPNLHVISFGREVPEAYYSFLQHGHVSFHLPRPPGDSDVSAAVVQDFIEALAKVISRT